jgi:CDGSH-type Zn-finger protein
MSNRVVVKPNGPLVLYGDIRIETADGAVIEQTDNAFLCRCGLSKNKPFCDGEHKRNGFRDPAHIQDDKAEVPETDAPLVVTVRTNAMLILKGPMRIESEDGKYFTQRNKAALCRCGQSKNKPFCDASHKACGFSAD